MMQKNNDTLAPVSEFLTPALLHAYNEAHVDVITADLQEFAHKTPKAF